MGPKFNSYLLSWFNTSSVQFQVLGSWALAPTHRDFKDDARNEVEQKPKVKSQKQQKYSQPENKI